MKIFIKILLIALISCNICLVKCQTETTTTTTTTTILSSSSTKPSTTTENSNLTTTKEPHGCGNSPNITCSECLKNVQCFYCYTDNKCKYYKVSGIFPEGCTASEARWFDCNVNLQALLISAGTIGAVVVLIVSCCVCYCCSKTCKAVSDRNLKRVENKILRQREQIRAKNEEKRQERQTKNDAIRVKYGLKPSTYSQMD